MGATAQEAARPKTAAKPFDFSASAHLESMVERNRKLKEMPTDAVMREVL